MVFLWSFLRLFGPDYKVEWRGPFSGLLDLTWAGCQRAIIYKTIMQIYMKHYAKVHIENHYGIVCARDISLVVPSEVPMRNLGKVEFLNGHTP
jgi:hypothetical protein